MQKKIDFSAFKKWLMSTEMFARPSKLLPGKWVLKEFYTEPGDELLHFQEDRIKTENLFWEIDFLSDDTYSHNTNLTVPLIAKIKNGTWSRYRNFLTLESPVNFRDNVEFQFAIVKGDLKLLKKDSFGKIEFFGFFRKPENS